MKKLIMLLVAFSLMASLAYAGHVNGYTRKDGTYVQGYERSNPNSTVKDNYSYIGNTNPYTGEKGSNYNRNSPSSDYYGTIGKTTSSKSKGVLSY